MIPNRLNSFHYHFADDPRAREGSLDAEALRGIAQEDDSPASFTSDESAARFYLSEILGQAESPAIRSIAQNDEPQRVPDLAFIATRDQRRTATKLVRFHQTHGEIPVFGAEVLVELDNDRQLVSMECQVGAVSDIPLKPSLKASEALEKVAEEIGSNVRYEEIPPPRLALFQTVDESWHLAWHLRDVLGRPSEAANDSNDDDYGLDLSPRDDYALTTYLVDAHTGEILFYYATSPTVAIPTMLDGDDEDGRNRKFWGQVKGPYYYLDDAARKIRTFDLNGGNIASNGPPSDAVNSTTPMLGACYKGPVAAHVNAQRVYEFCRSVLQRDGIDDAGMDIVSIVGCTYNNHTPEWRNAVWWKGRMWYGQIRNANGQLVSMARHLDIIAHELTHGMIEASSRLIYRDQAGALNESFADIFGIIIKNWYDNDKNDVSSWSWEIGAGLGRSGLPLRDLSSPGRTGDPAHMVNYVYTTRDYGGVHSNSNIHNKAAYNLLTSIDGNGQAVLSPEDWAILLYLAMTQIQSLASFADVPQELIKVMRTYLHGRPQKQRDVRAAIDDAYRAVGI